MLLRFLRPDDRRIMSFDPDDDVCFLSGSPLFALTPGCPTHRQGGGLSRSIGDGREKVKQKLEIARRRKAAPQVSQVTFQSLRLGDYCCFLVPGRALPGWRRPCLAGGWLELALAGCHRPLWPGLGPGGLGLADSNTHSTHSQNSQMRDMAESSHYCSNVCMLLWSDAPGAAPPPHTTQHFQPQGGFTTAP